MICSMMKKGVIGAALGAGALALAFGTSAPSYVKTAICKARDGAKGAVPIQFEIDRARQMVADLDPAIRANIENLARNEIEINHLQSEIVATRENLSKEKATILALREAVGTQQDTRLAGKVSYTAEEAAASLKSRFDAYKRTSETLAQREKTLAVREKAVVSAKEQLATMHAKKQELMTKIDQIEAQLKAIEATQAANEFTFDDSALSRVKETVTDIEKRIEIISKTAELEGRYAGEKPLPVLGSSRDIAREIDAEFGVPAQDAGTKTADKSL